MPYPVPTYNVLCFGEVLWDCLPDGRYPGGAPMNVAYHLTKLGCTAWLLSSVGADAAGVELLRVLHDFGLRNDCVGVDESRPTGVVMVDLADGLPHYEIREDVAWDYIIVPDNLAELCGSPDAIVYGSLAMRGAHNRRSFASLLDQERSALKVFDANVRPPFDDAELIRQLAGRADLIKMNDQEICALLGPCDAAGGFEHNARTVATRFRCDRICITAGAEGAGLLDHGSWFWTQSEAVVVRDTVGAGDAFLAGLVAGLLKTPDHPGQILAHASRLAGFVASKAGATPPYDGQAMEDIRQD